MKQKSNLFKVYSSFLVLMFTIFTYPSIAQADTANPPKIQSMKMLNTEKIYKVGDVVTFSIKYSGGSPGLKRVDFWAYNYIQGKYFSSDCLVGNSWYSLWGDKPSNYGLPIGPISPTEILMYKYVSANCIKGVNEVRLAARIADLTDLETDQVTGNDLFKFSVLDGIWIPPGEVLGNPIDTTFNLNFLPSEVVLEQGKSFEIKIPTRTIEGVPVSYQPWPSDVCSISQEPAFPWYQPIVEWFTIIEFKKSGICSLTSANATLTRSSIKEFVFRKEIKVITQLEIATAKAAAELKAKQEAEAKAAAELKAKQEAEAKAAAELKAKQEAEAKAAATKKTTITCVKGKLIKKVTAVKPKCPSGYKVKK